MEFTKDLWFTKRAQLLSSDANTVALYQILLGRDPENSYVIEEAKSQRICELMRSFLGSGEFNEYVIGPIREGKRLRHEMAAPCPTLEQRQWIASLLLLTSAQENTLSAASTWRELFLALLPPALVANPSEQASHRPTIGRVEQLGSTGIRGWALKLPVGSVPAEVECFIGELRLGPTKCLERRPDLKEVLGCSDAGFTLTFGSDVQIENLEGLDIRLVDALSSELIWGPLAFTAAAGRMPAAGSKLKDKIAAIEWQVSELKSMIDRFTTGFQV